MNKKLVMNVFLTIFFALLVINIVLYFFNYSYQLSFSDLFQKLSEAPRINFEAFKLAFSEGITEDWGLFNWFRDFVNLLWQIVGVLLYIGANIVFTFTYIFGLIKDLFVGVLG